MNRDPAGTKEERGSDADARAEEAALIQRVVDGEGRHYAVLVDRYQQRLYWSCRRLLDDPDEAEDVVQDAFVKAFEHLAEYDPTYRFYTWIYQIARNRCLNVLRKRKVWSLVSFQDPDRAPPVAANSRADRSVEDRELGLALAECRATLPVDQRECFDLRHAEALSYEEIAVAAEIPVGTVMSRLARAREKMRNCLQSKGIRWA